MPPLYVHKPGSFFSFENLLSKWMTWFQYLHYAYTDTILFVLKCEQKDLMHVNVFLFVARWRTARKVWRSWKGILVVL